MIVADHGYINDYNYPVTVQCIVREAQRQQLEPELLWAILRKENGRVGKHSLNSNKTVDIGPMQINNGKFEKALSELREKTHFSHQKFKHLLYNNACFNISVGAYVLRQKINAAKGDMFKGGGWYHSANEPFYSRYKSDLESKYYSLKRSSSIQKLISDAKRDLYAVELKIEPTKQNAKLSKPNADDYEITFSGADWLRPSSTQKEIKLRLY